MKKALLALLCLSVLATTPACRKKEEKGYKTTKRVKTPGKKKAMKAKGTKQMDESTTR